MPADRKDSRALTLGGAALAVATLVGGIWLFQAGSEDGKTPSSDGIVTVAAPTVAAEPAPAAAPVKAPGTALPALPAAVIADVRQTYPLLTDVRFGCDAAGCAVTATIPPPTGDAFLTQRQEMLLGGLAKVLERDGYRMLGPVHMDEVDDNLFHIRASVARAGDASPPPASDPDA
jgi:hypothetical protein